MAKGKKDIERLRSHSLKGLHARVYLLAHQVFSLSVIGRGSRESGNVEISMVQNSTYLDVIFARVVNKMNGLDKVGRKGLRAGGGRDGLVAE